MKIGIDARLWNETGVGRYIRNLVGQLAKNDTKNEYVLFVLSKDIQNGAFTFIEKKDLGWKIVPADIRWHSLAEQQKFPQILDNESLDLMHFPYFSVPIFYNKPYVITIHDLIINHFGTGKASTLPQPLYQLKLLGYKYIIKHAARNAQKIIVPLNAVKADVQQTLNIPSEKIVVTYEGIDEAVLDGNYPKNKEVHNLTERLARHRKLLRTHNVLSLARHFMYVGNAYPHKNLERLIHAFSNVLQKIDEKDFQLLLIGKQDFFYKRLATDIKKLGLQENIILMHGVNDDDLAFLYAMTTAVVLPSLMEGFGLPAVEAMANHKRLLVSDIPAFREVCDKAAIYFDPYDIHDIEKKLDAAVHDSLTKDPEELKRMKFAEARLGLFSWEKMAKQTKEVYESCTCV